MMYCPFLVVDYKNKRGKPCIKCEGAIVKFDTKEDFREFVKANCGSTNGWKDCSIAKNTMKHYEEE